MPPELAPICSLRGPRRKHGTTVSGWKQQLVSRIGVPDHAPVRRHGRLLRLDAQVHLDRAHNLPDTTPHNGQRPATRLLRCAQAPAIWAAVPAQSARGHHGKYVPTADCRDMHSLLMGERLADPGGRRSFDRAPRRLVDHLRGRADPGGDPLVGKPPHVVPKQGAYLLLGGPLGQVGLDQRAVRARRRQIDPENLACAAIKTRRAIITPLHPRRTRLMCTVVGWAAAEREKAGGAARGVARGWHAPSLPRWKTRCSVKRLAISAQAGTKDMTYAPVLASSLIELGARMR